MSKVRPIPEGMHTLTPVVSVSPCAEFIEFAKKALGATEVSRAADPSGAKIWHAQLRIGDSNLFCNDEFPEMGATKRTLSVWLYAEDVDAAYARALAAGATSVHAPMDMFWGDRTGGVADAWGNRWTLAQRVKDLSPAELEAAQAEAVAAFRKQ
jgi:PhnB protein